MRNGSAAYYYLPENLHTERFVFRPMRLQNALIPALQGSSSASQLCKSLICKNNCKQSVEEWNAAHQLLLLAVRNGTMSTTPDIDGNLFFWRDQLYCTTQHLDVAKIEDRNRIFKCLREAQKLGLIDTPDPYIQSTEWCR